MGGLICLACLVQALVIWRAAVPGLDSVRFVAIAQAIDRHGLLETLRSEWEQPLFPTWLWLVHEVVEAVAGPFPSAWAASAKLAAVVPLVLAVVPVYLLSLRLVGSAAALAGSVLWCLLPEVACLGAEGMSDSTHLLLFALAFWAIVEYWSASARESASAAAGLWQRCGWLLAAGVATAAALLCRAEVLVLSATLAIGLLLFQLRASWRQPWSKLASAGACYVLGVALVLGPVLGAVGAFTPGAALGRVLGRRPAGVEQPQPRQITVSAETPSPSVSASGPGELDVWRLADGREMSFAVKERSQSIRRRGYAAAIVMFAEELASVWGYGTGLLVLFGAWQLRHLPVRPVDRFIHMFFALVSLSAIWFSAVEGYLSARHLLTLVVAGIGCGGYGGLQLGRRLFRRWPFGWGSGVPDSAGSNCGEVADAGWAAGLVNPAISRPAWAVIWLLVAVGVVRLLEPLHANHTEHRRAGGWLASRAEMPGAVLDSHGWAGLYSGRPTYHYDAARKAFSDPQLAYVVLQRGELEYPGSRSETLRCLLRLAGERAKVFATRPNRPAVVVYRWHPERLSRLSASRPGRTERESL